MATRWGSRQKRKWTSLSVDETPGSFRRLGEDEATQGGWPAATLPDSALNGKGMPFFAGQEQGQSTAIPPEEHEQVTPPPRPPPQKGHGKVKASPDKVTKTKESGKETAVTKHAMSASLPRPKPAEKKPSVFKAFTWSKAKKSRSKLTEGSEGSEDLSCPPEDQETDPKIPDTQPGHPSPVHEYAERAVDVPGYDGTHQAKSSRTSSSSSSTTSSSDKESPSTTNLTPTHSGKASKTKKKPKPTQEGHSDLTKTSKKATQDLKVNHPQGSSTDNAGKSISKKASTTNPTSTPSSGAANQPLKTRSVEQSADEDKNPAKDVSQTTTTFKDTEDDSSAAKDVFQTTATFKNTEDESSARESPSPGQPPFDTGRRFRLEATVLVDDERPAERRVTYLGPVLLSPMDQRQGHYVHVTVAPGFGSQASEGSSLMVRPARPVPVNGGSSAPAAKESSTKGNGGQITAIPKLQTPGVNSQQNRPSPTRATEARGTASSVVEKDSSSSKSSDSGSRIEEDFMNAEQDINVSSRILVSSDESSSRCSTEPSGNAVLLDSGTETLHVVTEDTQSVFGPSPSPIPVDQSVVGKSSPLQCISPQLGGAACSFDGDDGRVSENEFTPQKRHQRSGSTSSSSSTSSSGEDGSKLGSYDFGEPCEKVPDKSEGTHALNHSEKDMEPSGVPAAVKERPCERVASQQQQESMAAPSGASPTDSPRRMGSFGRPHLELLDPHVLLSDESRKQAKEPRGTSSATESRCDLNTSAILEAKRPEIETTILPQSDGMIKERAKDCKLVVAEPVVISVTEHPDENSLQKDSITVHQPKDEEFNQSNDKHAEQDTTPSNGNGMEDDSKEKAVVKRPGTRPQKPVRVSLVKEDVTTAASTAPPNTETERPPLPLKGTPRQSSSSSPSSSSDSDDGSSRNKSTGNADESRHLENVHSTAHEGTPQSFTDEFQAGDENVKGREFQNDKDGSERSRQGTQMNVDPAEKQSSSSSPNSSQFVTDTSLMEDSDLPDSGKLEIRSTHEATVPQLPALPTSAVSCSKEASESDSSASSSVCGKKGARKPPVFVTPPPPPEIAVRTCASQSDLSERSDVEQDMVRIPPKPARSMDRLSPSASPAFDREKRRDKSSTSTPSAPSSNETDQDTKPPLVPPRREKPRVNGADHVCSNHRPQSGDHSADASCASSCDSKSLAQPSDQESAQNARAGKAEYNVNQGKPAPPAGGQPLTRESDPSGASAFVPYEESQIYFTDTPFTASHAASGSGQSIKGKSPESKSSSSSGESKKEKEYSPPPVPPRQRVTSKTAIVKTLNASTSSTASLDSRGSDGLLSTNFVKTTASAECILRAKNTDQLQGEHTHIDRPRAGTCPQIHLSHAVRDKADSSFESELPVQSEACTSDSSIFHSDVKLPLKPIRSPSPRTASRTPSPKVPAAQTPSPKPVPKSPAQSSGARGKTRGESTPHTDTDTSEADMRTSVNRSVSMSSSTSATSHEDVKSKKESRSKLGKYWPFRRKKANKKDKKLKGKATDDERSVSSPHLASLPLHQSTPTLDRYASEPNTSDISTSNKGEISDVSKLQDSDTSTLSESATEQSKQKKAGGKYVKDKKAHLFTSTSSSEQNKDSKAKEKDSSSKKKAAKKQKEITTSTGNQSTSSSKNVTPTPERKSKDGSKPEQTIRDSKDKLSDADKQHEISTSTSSTSKISKNPDTEKDTEEKSVMDLPLTPPRVATPLREHTPSFYPIPHHTPQDDIEHHRFDGEFQRLDEDLQADADVATAATERRPPMVVVAVDLGTTHSGYAFSFSRDPSSVYVMSRWAGQEPGLLNHKTLSALLLTPDARFHSFGLAARNHYHNLLPIEARHWLYFERFKMTLHHCKELSRDTMVTAINGTQLPALTVFAHVLEFFATHALQQLSDQSGTEFRRQDVRWVVTVPAIWREPAKQLMRQAALTAGMFTRADPSQMLIVLEPEAASIYCRKLRMHQLVPEVGAARPLQSPRRSMEVISNTPAVSNLTVGTRYMVVDCGGGTVDITVHELTSSGQLVELHRATGGPHGSTGVDAEFEALLRTIFSGDFLDTYQRQYPVGWVNLMTDFESRKRAASPFKTTSFNVSLPFTFISEYRKHKGEVDVAVKRHGDPEVEWSLQGMLRLAPTAMRRLFAPTLVSIRQAIGDVLNHPNTRDLRYLFLVGGFAESPLLQHEVRREFGHLLTVLIPQDVSLAVLRGAVLFGLDPKVVSVRCARLTYGVGILNRFDPAKHPVQKRVHREGTDWCTDIFDRFVAINEPVALGTSVTRRYTPARSGQLLIVLNVYSSVHPAPTFITDPGVRKCGTLYLDLRSSTIPAEEKSTTVKDGDGEEKVDEGAPREILARMAFGDTEISVTALDVTSGKEVKASVDFLSG